MLNLTHKRKYKIKTVVAYYAVKNEAALKQYYELKYISKKNKIQSAYELIRYILY